MNIVRELPRLRLTVFEYLPVDDSPIGESSTGSHTKCSGSICKTVSGFRETQRRAFYSWMKIPSYPTTLQSYTRTTLHIRFTPHATSRLLKIRLRFLIRNPSNKRHVEGIYHSKGYLHLHFLETKIVLFCKSCPIKLFFSTKKAFRLFSLSIMYK